MKSLYKLPILTITLLLVVIASACTGKSSTSSSVEDNTIESSDTNISSANETDTKITVIDTPRKRTSSQNNDDEDEIATSADDESDSTTNDNTVHEGDSNVQLSSYEGAANRTIKYSASGFEPAETVEIRITGLQYTAATFYSHDGTIPPSDLYIPPYDSSGTPMQGRIEIVAHGTQSGKEFTTYYTVNE